MSLKRSASQVSPHVLSLLAIYPNIPDETPKARSLVASPLGLGLGGAAQVSYCCLGFFWLTRVHACISAFFIRVHSQRETWACPTPHGFAYCKSSRDGGSALPRVSTCLSPLLILRQSSPGTAHLVSHRLVSAEPRALPATRPLGHSPVFPHFRRKACLSR